MESKLGVKAFKRSSTIHQLQGLQSGFLHSACKKPRRQPHPQLQSDEFASRDGDEVSHFVAKDLRIKRVFSPNLKNGSSVPSGEQISDKEGLIIANGSFPNEGEGVGKTNVELDDEDLRCNGKSEELGHSTPPDAEILVGNFMVASSDGCVEVDTYAKVDSRIDSVTRTTSVLKPCSKRKLFKAPGSIAYKRLLPFLLDSDNYTLQGDPYSKRENNLEKKTNIESNLCNRAKESSFVDSDACVKNAVFASGMSCKAVKLNLPPLDNGDTKNIQNGSDSNSDLTLFKEDSGLKKDDVVCASSHDKRLTENGRPKKHQTEDLSSKEHSKTSGMERLDGGNSVISSNNSSKVDDSKLYVSKKLCDNVSEDIKREDYFYEELKMSSLDSNITCNPVKEESRDENVECTRGADQNLGSSTIGENHCNIAAESDKKHGFYVRNKVVRNPLVQLKSSYSQVSVNYRRMLPFLEDLFKDNSENRALGNIVYPRPEKELPTMNLQPPTSNSSNFLDGLVSCKKPSDRNSDTLSMTVLNTINEMVCETEKVLMPAGVNDKLLSPPKLQIHPLHSEQLMLDKCELEMDPQLHGATLFNDQVVSSSYPAASYEPLTGEGSKMISKQSPITSEDCTSLTDNSDSAKLSERNSLGSNSSYVEPCILPENGINVRKGILKRNPRGCRGICTCLNCSSFRLHAERTFEFSRNQLQDAEEVASDLMKELSFLRDVLEKFSDGVKGDAGYHSNEVKEACRKASEAELIAKDRLLQLNYELDIHCRITCSQRPNVRFSSEVEKREIEDGK